MALETVSINFHEPVAGNGTPTVLAVVPNPITLVLKSDEPGEVSAATAVVALTMVKDGGRTIGWDRSVNDVRPMDVDRVHSQHKYTGAV